MSLLSLSNVQASYGDCQALFGVDLKVDEGEVVALMGRNGMGKSTTIKCICQLLKSKGNIVFNNTDVSGLPSHKVAQSGIGLVPEGRRCFARLTVQENLLAAARAGYWNQQTINDLFPVLSERKNQVAASLSGGEQQMLAIARALMTNPRLLILDEATEGLAPMVRREIWRAVSTLKAQTGLSILVVDKSVAELKVVCDTAYVLERGTTVWNGNMTALSDDLAARYLGV